MTDLHTRVVVNRRNVPAKWQIRDAFVPKARYIEREFLELELERLFTSTWLNACRLEEVERVGDYVDFEIGEQSILVVRSESGLHAFYNACRHRGTRLVRNSGRVGELRCPFHAWRWNLDGSLKHQPDQANFESRENDDLALQKCLVDTWGGWVFVNMDPNAEPLQDYLEPMPTRLHGLKLEDMRIAWYKSFVLPANWKTALDAFIESWHVPGTHPQLLRSDKRTTAASVSECESHGRTFNELFRLHSRHGDDRRYGPDSESQGSRFESVVNPQLILDSVNYYLRELRTLTLRTDLFAAAELRAARLEPGVETLPYPEVRAKHARAAGIDYPTVSMEQMRKAMYDWHVFPNTVFLVDLGTALVYRSRPNGLDPNSCIFDVQGLELPSNHEMPRATRQSFEDWRDGDVGEILTQDFTNMSEVTIGLHSRSFDGHRLNLKQEMTIWNYHRAIDEFLFEGSGHQFDVTTETDEGLDFTSLPS